MMKFNLKTLSPWADITTRLQQMKTLTIVADGKRFDGEAKLEHDGQGNVTVTVGKKKRLFKKEAE